MDDQNSNVDVMRAGCAELLTGRSLGSERSLELGAGLSPRIILVYSSVQRSYFHGCMSHLVASVFSPSQCSLTPGASPILRSLRHPPPLMPIQIHVTGPQARVVAAISGDPLPIAALRPGCAHSAVLRMIHGWCSTSLRWMRPFGSFTKNLLIRSRASSVT